MKIRIALILAAIAAFPQTAFAHHPTGGATPGTMAEGILSGFAHPVIGLDHLAFVVAVGIAAVLAGRRFMLPALFVAATLAGTGIHLAAFNLPLVETVIALSVVAGGFIILSGTKVPVPALAALFAIAGLFHGYAYGESIVGAETTPLVAYLTSFGIVQFVIAVAAGAVVVEVLGAGKQAFENASSRITGGMVAGAGLFVLGSQALAVVGLAP